MEENKVIALENPGADERDALTGVLRQGACRMLAQTVEAEVEAFVAAYARVRDEAGPRHSAFSKKGRGGQVGRVGSGSV